MAHTSPDPPADVYRRQAAGSANPWWGDDSQERYWLEITDRPDIGAELHDPATRRDGRDRQSNEMDDAAPRWVLDTRDPIAERARLAVGDDNKTNSRSSGAREQESRHA